MKFSTTLPIALILVHSLPPVSADCDCVCQDGNAVPYIMEMATICGVAPLAETTECVDFVCAKCAGVLECYVDTGNDDLDIDICDLVLAPVSPTSFCKPNPGGKKNFTDVQQQCSGSELVQCYTGARWTDEEWDVNNKPINNHCPAEKQDKCRNGHGLSNFGIYKYCPPGAGASCTATGNECSGFTAFSQYSCTVTNDDCEGEEDESLTGLSKCDVDVAGTCSYTCDTN